MACTTSIQYLWICGRRAKGEEVRFSSRFVQLWSRFRRLLGWILNSLRVRRSPLWFLLAGHRIASALCSRSFARPLVEEATRNWFVEKDGKWGSSKLSFASFHANASISRACPTPFFSENPWIWIWIIKILSGTRSSGTGLSRVKFNCLIPYSNRF